MAGAGMTVLSGELTEAGLSTRAIAPVVGVSNKTVHQDRETGVTRGNTSTSTTPDVEDGGTTERPSDEAPAVVQPEGGAASTASSASPADEAAPHAPAPRPPAPVVGIDGKSYSRPARPRQAHRDDAEPSDDPHNDSQPKARPTDFTS